MGLKIFLPGLNGIRAIAAFAVIISHINNRLEYFKLPKGNLLDLATYGVTIFFTLSGFLITFLLLKEMEHSKTVEVRKFYIRRVLRIWPLYYIYLIIIIFVSGLSNIRSPVLFYLLMVPNFKNSFDGIINTSVGSILTTGMLGHYWSLGVEEQFYAFWPWIVKSKKFLLKFLIIFPAFYLLLKLTLRIFDAPYSVLVFVNYTRFGCLVLGGLGAYIFFYQKERLSVFNKRGVEIAAFIFFLFVASNKFHITSIIDHEIVSLFTLIIIFNQVNNPKRLFSFENKVFDYLGKISFGLYVYHPLIIYLMSLAFNYFTINNVLFKTISIYFFVISMIIVVAHISYNFFEKRFLTLKTKYTTVQSVASSKELNK